MFDSTRFETFFRIIKCCYRSYFIEHFFHFEASKFNLYLVSNLVVSHFQDSDSWDYKWFFNFVLYFALCFTT